jgi:hypothetical protein
MTKRLLLALFVTAAIALAQEPTITPTPSASPSRSVRISFVPPPLEGTISLGIYDANDQLVRVLHQEAGFDEFTVGPDALVTKWDGKDDFGNDLPAGTYHARGFLVAPMKIEEIPASETDVSTAVDSIIVKLIANPLEKNERRTIQISAALDDEDLLLETADGLPLLTVTQAADARHVAIMTEQNNSATLVLDTDSGVRRFSVSGINRIMAFDCGKVALK